MPGVITIVGCANRSLFVTSERLPTVGETVSASGYSETVGGKGAIQAAAAAGFGADARFIGRLGTDSDGRSIRERLDSLGVDTVNCISDTECRPGIGITLVDSAGNNMISVAPGTNHILNRADIDGMLQSFRDSTHVGFQLQNTHEAVWYGLRAAHDSGCTVFLDPAPAVPIPDDVYPMIDIIKPNEIEAALLTGISVIDAESALMAGRHLVSRGVGAAIITLGHRGAVAVTAGSTEQYAGHQVETVDTTGAGDIFSGALLAELARGTSFADAIPFACAAAALSTCARVCIDAIPPAEDVRAFMSTAPGT